MWGVSLLNLNFSKKNKSSWGELLFKGNCTNRVKRGNMKCKYLNFIVSVHLIYHIQSINDSNYH